MVHSRVTAKNVGNALPPPQKKLPLPLEISGPPPNTAHQSPQSKRHFDRVSRFSTAHRKLSLQFIMGAGHAPQMPKRHESIGNVITTLWMKKMNGRMNEWESICGL